MNDVDSIVSQVKTKTTKEILQELIRLNITFTGDEVQRIFLKFVKKCEEEDTKCLAHIINEMHKLTNVSREDFKLMVTKLLSKLSLQEGLPIIQLMEQLYQINFESEKRTLKTLSDGSDACLKAWE
jgi:hypothetical protein